ncbi:MAG: cytochrome P450 [Vulcanimicrobiaceae bacterium]
MSQNVARDVKHDDAARVLPTNGALPLPPGPGLRGGAAFVRAAAAGTVLDFLSDLGARYGALASFPLGLQRIVVASDPALVEEILVTRQHAFVRDTGAVLLRELVGEGLLTTDDPAHLERRRLMQPAFHRARVAHYGDLVVAETERLAATWRAGSPIDVGAAMAELTLAALGAALFGRALGAEAAEIADVLARVTRRGGVLAALLAVAGPLVRPVRAAFPRRASLLFPRERARLEAIVAPLVRRERAAGTGDDLLGLLLAASDGDGARLDDAAVRNEVCMLVLAGHETTANALTWTFALLARHPAVEARLHAEIDAVCASGPPTVADLSRLPYASAVFDEALRLYPPAPAFARRPTSALELGGYRIPAGASVFVSPYVMQRDPRFFPDPHAFAPERWRDATHPKFAFFPFGGGSKMCIGEPFARMEAVLAIATIARRYRLRLASDAPLTMAARGLLKPARPVLLAPVRR